MDREEFERVVRGMQEQGVPLTMANLMVRTELPRAQIESWLDQMQRGAKFTAPRAASTRVADGDEPRTAPRPPPEGLLARAKALQEELVGEAVKARLGVTAPASPARKSARRVGLGAGIGLLFPPAGLAYAAPWRVVAVGSGGYVALAAVAWLFSKLFFLSFFGTMILMLLHLLGAAAGAGYAWRYNRRGKRTNLLPGGERE